MLAEALKHIDPARNVKDIESSLRRDTSSICELVAGSPYAGRRLLLFIDQFEELFRFRRRNVGERAMDESALYVKLLLDSVRETDSRIYVVTTMRSEYLEDGSEFYDLSNAITQGVFLLPRMTRLQCEEAIVSPAESVGLEIEPALIQRLLNESEERADGLPLLQHALRVIQDRWARDGLADRPLALEHFAIKEGSSGTLPMINQLLDQRLDLIYQDEVRAEDWPLAQTCFKLLSEYDARGRETRRSCPVAELMDAADAPLEQVERVITAFRRELRGATFIRAMNKAGERVGDDGRLQSSDILDLSHECLMRQWARLKLWMRQEYEKASIFRDLDRDAVGGGKLSSFATRRYAKWREESKPTAAWAARYSERFNPVAGKTYVSFANAMDFLRRQERRQWFYRLAWIAGPALLLLVAVGLTLLFAALWRNQTNATIEAKKQKTKAEMANATLRDFAKSLEKQIASDEALLKNQEMTPAQARAYASRNDLKTLLQRITLKSELLFQQQQTR